MRFLIRAWFDLAGQLCHWAGNTLDRVADCVEDGLDRLPWS